MDKNKRTYDVPAADIQEKITLLMGLPPEEAGAKLDKHSAPKRITEKQLKESKIENESNSNANSVIDENIEQPLQSDEKSIEIVDIDIENQEDDAAVDDIVAQENKPPEDLEEKKEFYELSVKKPKGIKRIFLAWWGNKILRNTTIALIIGAMVALLVIPTTRYGIFNAIGLTASTEFIVTDEISGKPVKNVLVKIQDQESKTDENGKVIINNLELGDTTIYLSKRSFKAQEIPVVIGLGSNPFADPFEILPTGTTFTFVIKDSLSGLPVAAAEVTDGESVAIADENGSAQLTIEPTDNDIELSISGNLYRTEKLTIPAEGGAPNEVLLVASQKDIFVSKRDGKFDLYSRYVDGKEETLLVAGTGNEQADTHVAPNPVNPLAAFVSAREGQRNNEGYILSDIYIVDSSNKAITKIDGMQSERIRIIGWIEDSVIFAKTVAGPSAAFSTRQKLIAYDTKKKETHELATTDYFTDVKLINGKVYYVIGASDGTQSKGLTVVDVNGENKKVLLAKTIWMVYRTNINELLISADGNEWYAYNLGSASPSKLDGAPANPLNNVFVSSPNNKNVAWIETRDGKQIIYQKTTEKDSKEVEVHRKSGATYPLRWLNDTTLLYTVSTPQESATYVVSTKGGNSLRVGDVTTSYYGDTQYYY